MKALLTIILLFILTKPCLAQDEVVFSYSSKKMADKTFEIHLSARMKPGWHIYSQNVKEGAGSFPTKISFIRNPVLFISGTPNEIGKMISKNEDLLGVTLKFYNGKVDFVQPIKLKANVKTSVSGTISYMVCTDSRCLPPKTIQFSVTLE